MAPAGHAGRVGELPKNIVGIGHGPVGGLQLLFSTAALSHLVLELRLRVAQPRTLQFRSVIAWLNARATTPTSLSVTTGTGSSRLFCASLFVPASSKRNCRALRQQQRKDCARHHGKAGVNDAGLPDLGELRLFHRKIPNDNGPTQHMVVGSHRLRLGPLRVSPQQHLFFVLGCELSQVVLKIFTVVPRIGVCDDPPFFVKHSRRLHRRIPLQ